MEIVKNEGPAHYNDSFRDITEQKEAEEKIRKLNEELERRIRVRTAEPEKKPWIRSALASSLWIASCAWWS